MKSKDIAIIIAVAGFAGIVAFALSNFFFASPESLQTTVKVIEPITADFSSPDSRYFNDQAVNPTKLITIGDNANPNPFTDVTQ